MKSMGRKPYEMDPMDKPAKMKKPAKAKGKPASSGGKVVTSKAKTWS